MLVLHNHEKIYLNNWNTDDNENVLSKNEHAACFRPKLIRIFNIIQFHHNSLNGAFTS